MLLAAVGVAAVLGAEPQCPDRADQRSCVAGYESGLLSLAMSGGLLPAEATAVQCVPEAQAHRDLCQVSTCALRLVVTSPAEYAFSVCVHDTRFEPYKPSTHIDENHPLRRKELQIAYVHGGGCDPSLYSRAEHEGKIVIFTINEGACAYWINGPVNAARVGAAAVLMLSYRSIMTERPDLSGPALADIPAVLISSHHGGLIREAMFDKGLPVTAYLDLACDASPATPPPSLPVTDNCPYLSLLGKCSNQADPEHRLCNRCPQQLSWGGKSVCLWGNSLVPRDGRNHLKSVLSLPADVTAVYIESPTRIGCSPGEFAGLAGTIVFTEETPIGLYRPLCPPMISARNAEAEGVIAFVSITARNRPPVEPSGPSQFVTIPVHTTLPSDYDALVSMFHAGTKEDHLPGKPRYVLRNAQIVDEAVADPYRPANVTEVKGPVVAIVDDLASFDWTPAVIVSLVVIIVMTVLIAWRLHQQHSQSVVLPAESVGSTFTVPLSVASMGLSISLVLIIAVVAFSLAHAAGQSATDTALEDGNAATMQTYHSAQENADEQAQQVTKAVTGRVLAELESSLDRGEQGARAGVKVYKDTDTSWASWNSRYQAFVDIARGYCCDDSLSPNIALGQWSVAMLSAKGFYAGPVYKTDDRPDAARNDGHAHVSVTEDASLYGLMQNFALGPRTENIPVVASFRAGLPDLPTKRIGTWPGDQHAAVAGRRSGHSTWALPRDSLMWNLFDEWVPENPVSVLTPVYNRDGLYVGVIEAVYDVKEIADALEKSLSSDAALANVSIVVVDKASSNLVVNTRRDYSRVVDQYLASGAYTPHRQLISLQESVAIEYNALSSYLKTIPDVGSSHTGQFDQETLYVRANQRVFDVRASSGGVTDVSGNVYSVESRGGSCGGCTTSRALWDGSTGEVMVFDGANSVLIYQNLTTDVPHVAATRRGSGAWDNTVSLYRTARPLAGVGGGADQQCVVRADLFTPGQVGCMLRGHYFDKPYAIVARFKPSADVSEKDRSQEIFTEAIVGETSVRMFASGAVSMNVLAYGCGTKPVEGGTKGGEWVSVAFVRTATNCTTFVNGKLWDTSLIVGMYNSQPHGVPFEVGRGFVGEISSVQMLNVTVNEKEATGLHENDVFVRDVPSKTWLLEIGRIKKEDLLHTGLDWIVATMVPRADVMRRVDENNRVMLRNLEVQEDNTKTKLRQRTNETIIVIVAIALASVFVFLVFNDLLTRPFAHVCVVMAEAAVMRIEEIPDISSKILEINAIHRAMVLMTRNLKEYKAYMPQSVLADTDEDEESAHQTAASNPSVKSSPSVSRMTSDTVSSMAREAGARRAGMALSIAKKKCTFAVINLVGFHAKVSSLSEKKVVDAHGKVVESVLKVAQGTKGICDGFSGDRFLLSFNGLKTLASHRMAGCTAGVRLRDVLKEEHEFEVSSAVVCGEARVGNMGCEVMRKYTFVSPALSWGYALERYARSLSCAVLTDHFIVNDMSSEFVRRTVGQVVFEKRLADGNPLTISCVLEKHAGGDNEEWMYALEEMAAADPQAAWNKFAAAVLGANWEVCRHTHTHTHTALSRCFPQEAASLAPPAPDSSDIAAVRLVRAAEERAYTPSRISFQ